MLQVLLLCHDDDDDDDPNDLHRLSRLFWYKTEPVKFFRNERLLVKTNETSSVCTDDRLASELTFCLKWYSVMFGRLLYDIQGIQSNTSRIVNGSTFVALWVSDVMLLL